MYYNNKKLIISIFWVVLGVALVTLSYFEIIESTYWSGFGGGLVAVGVLQIIKNLKYQKSDEYRDKIDIEAGDERNKFIRMKTWSWVGYIMILAMGVAEIVLMTLGKNDFAILLGYAICFMIGLYWIIYFILQKKY